MKKGSKVGLILFLAVFMVRANFTRADLIVVHHSTFTTYSESSGAFIRENSSNTEELTPPVVGPDGRIYAAGNGVGQGTILRFTETASNINDVLVPYASGGFTVPFGMAFGANGDIFAGSIVWTNFTFGYGRILQFNGSTGEYIRELIPPRENILPMPSGMAVGPDGAIYVTDQQLGLARFVGRTRDLLATNLVNSPHFAPDGTLYVKSSATAVQRYDSINHSFVPFIDVTNFGITNRIVGTFGPDGLYYFADSPPDPSQTAPPSKVYRYDPKNGSFLGIFAVVQSKDPWHLVAGIAFSGAHLSISVSDKVNSLRYPKIFRGFTLEQSNSLEPGAGWTPVSGQPSEIGMELVVTNTSSDSPRFFRLRR
jgi:hypothetical protein